MKFIRASFLLLGALGVTSRAAAHFNMLLPQSATARRGETVPFLYQWGHPFEHQLFDAPAPEAIRIRTPGGRVRTPVVREVSLAQADRKARGYQFSVSAQERGDYVLVLRTPPIWMEEEQEFLLDQVRVVLHVQVQRGWDAALSSAADSAGTRLELPEVLPLTRPYGLQPGMVFQGQLLLEGKGLAGSPVEVERYNPTPPRELPPDEQMTRVVKTDPNGVFTCTLPEPGWWCMTGQRDGGKRDHNGRAFPVRQRATLWVYVDEALSQKPSP